MTGTISHNAIFAQIGHALHAWTNIETALSEYFVAIHGVGWQETDHPIRTVFEAVISFDARLAMIESSLRRDPDIQVEYEKLFVSLKNKLIKQYRNRHMLAHFKMAVDWSGPTPEAVIMPFYTMAKHMSQSQKTLSASDVLFYRGKFAALNQRLNLHADYICQIKGKPTQWTAPGQNLLAEIQADPG